ncbi:MAG: type IX secretion system membrane protein PorP/SprF [Bacteroidales bacterium]|nr:type IX secretion system membrane protein PorP/SprF [Bacteroidales bacterium]MDT8429974.1 type IX secretion system membrane protein PorP/SprF [Bacteroidales bacterium]
MRRFLIRHMLVLLLTGCFATVSGQQQPVYSQYMLDKFIVNPAVAGANGITTINLISRQQYVGLENAPRTFALNAQSRLLEDSYILRRLRLRNDATKKSRSGRVGLAGSVFTDRNGIVSRTGFQGTYAYHLNFRNLWQLSGGLTLHGYQFRVDDTGVPLADEGDPLLSGNSKTFFVPDASAGIFVTNGVVYGGVALSDLLASQLKLGREVYSDYETLRKYNLLAGAKLPAGSSWSVEPSVLLQGSRTSFMVDLTTRVFYTDNFWTGVTYRSVNSVVFMVGGKIDRLYMGYAFDMDIGPVRTYSSGSHEVIIGVRIGEYSRRRVRWFMQDQRNYDI